ncbi:hypothetical protein [uncultured Mucilaginibacter sp.]|uniref:hypothetical protein n=1 Tax=uncultured Mucilaginibacter sp. TaxID=797541 RepID=UPI002631FFE7|nr:hypothetical protein [uncultured Mucilaginibacter sp.]
METQDTSYLGVELKLRYFEEFKICGLPIPPYSKGSGFVLKFDDAKSYLNYRTALKAILFELHRADPKNSNYEIQHSKALIKYVLYIMREELSKRQN